MTLEDAIDIVAPHVRGRIERSRAHQLADAARYRGVTYAGMRPEPQAEPSEASIRAEILDTAERRVAWSKAPTQALLSAAREIAGQLEAVRAIVSRAGVPERLGEGDRDSVWRTMKLIRGAVSDLEVALVDMEAR